MAVRSPALQMIDLDQDLIGHRKFLSCWAWITDELTYIVDPGPRATADRVIGALRAKGVQRLDYILVSHVHLDHAGAAADVLAAFPDARVVCHERAREHLIDPARLWEGSLGVLGPIAQAYQIPNPVPAEKITEWATAQRAGITILSTPGHAAHHLSFMHGEILFVGEAAGLRIPLPDHIYTRPATPPRFRLDIALESIRRLEALSPTPRRMAYPHYGIVDDPESRLRSAREQMVYWVKEVRHLLEESDDDIKERVHKRMLAVDSHYANFVHLDDDLQAREYHYVGQTLDGMVGYVCSE